MKEALRAMESSIMGIREYNEDMKFGADYCLFMLRFYPKMKM